MEIQTSLKTVLKRLRLSGILHTLPDRFVYAKKTKMPYQDMLELILQDEIDRRDHKGLQLRLQQAQFTEEQTFENFDWDAPVTFDRDRVRDLFSLAFIQRREDVIFMGPVGVGKTFLASALGHSVCRAGKKVLFLRADSLLKELHQSRADHSTDKVLRRFIAPELLIIDDFGLRPLDRLQSNDIYEVLIERHKRSSTILTTCARKVSCPTLVASTFRTPCWLTVAPMTSSPFCFVTGTDSPVAMLSSTALSPSTTRPSVGIFSPGRTIIRSPVRT